VPTFDEYVAEKYGNKDNKEVDHVGMETPP
jgi:hypothetical protein